jgi:hypothetical protein
MTNKLMISAAIGALMVSGALAQSPTSPSKDSATPPPAAQSQPTAKPADTKASSQPADTKASSQPAADKTAQSKPAGEKAAFVSSQKPDQWLATKFKGTDVLGADNQKIGDVSDILFDKSGKIEAYVVSVGGFLGMGAKEVALAPSAFDVVPGSNGAAPKLKISMTKDELKAAQNFARYEAPRPAATTGSASGLGGSTSGGMGGGMRPSSNTPPATPPK